MKLKIAAYLLCILSIMACCQATPAVFGAYAVNELNPDATSLTLPAGGQLYVYAMGTGGRFPTSTYAQGNSIPIFNGSNFITAEIAVSTNPANTFTTQTYCYTSAGFGVSDFTYAQGFYDSSSVGANLSASVRFSLIASALVVVVAVGGNQFYLHLSGLSNLTYDVNPSEGVVYNIWTNTPYGAAELYSIPLAVAHTYLGPGTYTVQENTSGASWQAPSQSGDIIGVLIFSDQPNAAASSDPQIPIPEAISLSNVRASQRMGTGLVDIFYDLTTATNYNPTAVTNVLTVSLAVSTNSGATFNVLPTSLSGDVGAGITPGANKHIVWNAEADLAASYFPNVKVRLTATP